MNLLTSAQKEGISVSNKRYLLKLLVTHVFTGQIELTMKMSEEKE